MAKPKSEDETRAAIDRLAYEINMLTRMASILCRHPKYELSWICTNSFIHSFLLAARNLLEFFFPKKVRGNIYATTCVPSWECEEPVFEKYVHWSKVDRNKKGPEGKDFVDILSQRLHHITWPRVEESKLDWHEQAITKEFLKPIEKFQEDLPPELRSYYFDASVRELQETCKRFEQQQ